MNPQESIKSEQSTDGKQMAWVALVILSIVFLPIAAAWFLPKGLATRETLWTRSRRRAVIVWGSSFVAMFAGVLLFSRWEVFVSGQQTSVKVMLAVFGVWLLTLPVAVLAWHIRVGRIANEVFDRTCNPNRLHEISTAIWRGSVASTRVTKVAARPIVKDRDQHYRPIVGARVNDDRRSTARRTATAAKSQIRSAIIDRAIPVSLRSRGDRYCGFWVTQRHVVLPEMAWSALVLGGTGSGKTTLICGMSAANMRQRGSVAYFNGKGDAETEETLRAIAEAQGVPFRHWTVVGNEPFDGWQGTSSEIVTKVLSLLGVPTSDAARYYLGQTRTVLERAAQRRRDQHNEPWVSAGELIEDLDNPVGLDVSAVELKRVRGDIERALAGIAESVSGRGYAEGWGWESTEESSITLIDVLPHDQASKAAATLMLFDLLGYKENRRNPDAPPLMVVIEEAQVLLTNDVTPPIDILLEQVRSANIGVIVATQSVTGLGADALPQRLLDSGVPIIAGNMPFGEEVSNRAGTRSRVETGLQGDADGPTGMVTSRVQETYLVPPQRLRETPVGCFVLITRTHEPVWFKALPPSSFHVSYRVPIKPWKGR